MKLSQKAIDAVSNRPVMLALAIALDFSEVWIEKLIQANKSNGPLTTAAALKTIQEKTELPSEEILEQEKVNAE